MIDLIAQVSFLILLCYIDDNQSISLVRDHRGAGLG
jgi:hypothetical protein